MRIAGLVLIVLAIGLGLGGNVTSFFDVVSAIIVFLGTLALLLFSGSDIGAMFKTFFSGSVTPEDVQAGSRAWMLAGVYSLVTGAIGTLIGLIIMLKNMDDPAAIGPGMALGLMTQFYGFLLAFAVAWPMYRSLKRRMALTASAAL